MEDYYEAYGAGEEDDDIAEFEKRCFGDQHTNYLAGDREKDKGESSSEEDEQIQKAKALKAPKTKDQWQDKIKIMEAKLSEKDQRIQQLQDDLKLVHTDATQMTGEDIVSDLKAKLIELTKKNRRLQVTCETQKTQITTLERGSAKKPTQKEEMTPSRDDDGYKQKYLASSNKIQEIRHEVQELKSTIQKQRKILLKELGSQDEVEKAFACADDPFSLQWQGRAAQISKLERHIKEMKGDEPKAATQEPPKRALRVVGELADQRRQEFEEMKGRVSKLEDDNSQLKQHRDGFKSRSQHLEKTVRDLKMHVQVLIEKSDNDDKLLQNWQQCSEKENHAMRQAKMIGHLQNQIKELSGEKGIEARQAAAFAAVR